MKPDIVAALWEHSYQARQERAAIAPDGPHVLLTKREHARLTHVNSELKAECDAVSARLGDLQQQHDALLAQNDALKVQVEDLTVDEEYYQTLVAQNNTLRAKNKQHVGEATKKRRKYNELVNRYNGLGKTSECFRSAFEAREQQLEKGEDRIAKLEDKLAQERQARHNCITVAAQHERFLKNLCSRLTDQAASVGDLLRQAREATGGEEGQSRARDHDGATNEDDEELDGQVTPVTIKAEPVFPDEVIQID